MPTEYRLLLAQQYFLRDKTLVTDNELKIEIGDFCDSKPVKFYKGIYDLPCHCKQVIKNNDDYSDMCSLRHCVVVYRC